MGKIKAKTKKTKPHDSSKMTKNTPLTLSQLIPEDCDIKSVHSFKSIKNRFGIKKQITKNAKLKLKKEILKQKIDYVKEAVRSSSEHKNEPLRRFDEVTDEKIVRDEEEDYMKLGNKNKKLIARRKKRKQQMTKDIDTLKNLMFCKKNQSDERK